MFFLEFFCFSYDPTDFGNLVTGSSAFSKSSFYFLVHILLKPCLKDFEHYVASMWNEHNCVVVECSLALPFFGIGMKTDFFQTCGHCCIFQIFWHIEYSLSQHHLLGFEIAQLKFHHLCYLFIVMLPKAHLTSHSRMSGSR